MPYDRDKVVASVTDFYSFLTTYLHFQPSELKIPPPSGWPQINQTRFAFLGKSDKVVDLLQHLPYLTRGEEDKHIYDHTVCVDYTDECVDRKEKHPGLYITHLFEPTDELKENCEWPKFRERHEHVAVLGLPEVGDKGCYIFLDTLDGEVAVWDVIEPNYLNYSDAAEFFAWLRQQYEEVKLFPTPREVNPLLGDRFQGLRDAIRSFGWPPKEGDRSEWKREECLKEVRRTIRKYLSY